MEKDAPLSSTVSASRPVSVVFSSAVQEGSILCLSVSYSVGGRSYAILMRGLYSFFMVRCREHSIIDSIAEFLRAAALCLLSGGDAGDNSRRPLFFLGSCPFSTVNLILGVLQRFDRASTNGHQPFTNSPPVFSNRSTFLFGGLGPSFSKWRFYQAFVRGKIANFQVCFMFQVCLWGFLRSLAVPRFSDTHLDLCIEQFDRVHAHVCLLRNAIIAFDQLRSSTAAQLLMQPQHEDHRTVSASCCISAVVFLPGQFYFSLRHQWLQWWNPRQSRSTVEQTEVRTPLRRVFLRVNSLFFVSEGEKSPEWNASKEGEGGNVPFAW